MSSPEFATAPHHGRIVGALNAVKDASYVPSSERIIRIHVDQRVNIIYDVVIRHVTGLQ